MNDLKFNLSKFVTKQSIFLADLKRVVLNMILNSKYLTLWKNIIIIFCAVCKTYI